MSDLSPSTAWPAASPTGISPIQHPAWEEARNAILDLAAEGPITAVIVGEPGTGKTWLLRELASSLGDHGFPTMMLMQGNLPMTLSSGAALLVDQASLMSEAMLKEMSAQQHGVCVLAGVEWFEDELDPAAPSPVIIRLRPLDPDEITDFVTEWLFRAASPAFLDAATLSHLAAQSGGRVGTIVTLLGEAIATRNQPPVTRPTEPLAETPPKSVPEALPEALPESIPESIPETFAEEPVLPVVVPLRRRSIYRPMLAASAIAATIVLGWALLPVPPPAKIAQSPTSPPVVADASATTTPPPLPPLQQAETPHPAQPVVADAVAPAATSPAAPLLTPAETPHPALVAASIPARPNIAAPPLAASPIPNLEAADTPPDSPTTTSLPAIAAAPPPPVLGEAEPTVVATLNEPAPTTPPAPPRQSNRTGGGPGLVLLAQRGDTLERLYGSVYRDRKAPPFATVLAANPGPFKPGAIVVFPEPPGGWQRVQR